MTIKTLNFHPHTDPKLICTCGHPDCDQRSVNQKTLDMAQAGRDILRHGLSVTSGGRCPSHPNEIQRTTPADHQKGNGIDIMVNGSTRGNVVAAGLEVGFNAIGVAKTFVHWGYRKDLPDGHKTMWVY
jgi:hypothetical protein